MLKLLYRANLRLIREYFKTERTARLITVFLFLFVFVGLAAGLFFFFKHGFAYIKNDSFFGPSISLLAYEFFFLGISALIFASALISGLFGFFQIDAAPWILSSPRFRILPNYIAFKISASSLWPLIFVALPGLLAISSVSHLGAGAVLIMILALIFLAIFAVFSAEFRKPAPWLDIDGNRPYNPLQYCFSD